MGFEDLDIRHLLESDGDETLVRLAEDPALVLEAGALGLLRQELVAQMGRDQARILLGKVGYSLGWRMAGDPDSPWARRLRGLFGRGSGAAGILEAGPREACSFSMESIEAEAHLTHLGPSDMPACWVFTGLASGYLSRIRGRDTVVREEACAAMGSQPCLFEIRTPESWDAPAATLPPEDPDGLVAHSPSMRRLVDLARRVAATETTLLVTGESGTGKERIARRVHGASGRAAGPFIAVNCGAIPEALLESELFGHARGAYTGAVSDRPGLFESANGGTLLLDEVGEVPLSMQVKLLRVLQEREVRRVGENRSRPVDARVIAATNADLAQEVSRGRFRRDLYYRLDVVELHLPPLRERREDILPLARLLLAQAASRLRSPALALSPALEARLLRYPWPGNVRELENLMERAAALADGPVLESWPGEGGRAAPPLLEVPARPLAAIEQEYILAVLDANAGNQARTAAQLGIGTATLYRKLKQYGRVRGRMTVP